MMRSSKGRMRLNAATVCGASLLLEAREEAEVPGRDLDHVRLLAPCAIQRPRRSRSALVIPVTFPSGIACVLHRLLLDRGGCALISSGVSSLIPRGAVIDASSATCEWQTAQRCSTMPRLAQIAIAVPAVDSAVGRIRIAITAIAIAAVAGIAQMVRPDVRKLKKWRIHAPIDHQHHEDQPAVAVAVGNGKWFASIAKHDRQRQVVVVNRALLAADSVHRVRLAPGLLRAHELPVRRDDHEEDVADHHRPEHRADLEVRRARAEQVARRPRRRRSTQHDDASDERPRAPSRRQSPSYTSQRERPAGRC